METLQVLIFGFLAPLVNFSRGIIFFLFPCFDFSTLGHGSKLWGFSTNSKKIQKYFGFFLTYSTQNVAWTFFEQKNILVKLELTKNNVRNEFPI